MGHLNGQTDLCLAVKDSAMFPVQDIEWQSNVRAVARAEPSVIGSLTKNQNQMEGWKPPARSPKTPDSKRQWTRSPAPPGTVATVRPLGTIRALGEKAMLVAGETPLSPLGLGACVEMGRTAQDMDHKMIDQEVRIHP